MPHEMYERPNVWTPASAPALYAKILGWYDPRQATLVDGKASFIPDQGPNGYDVIQTVDANRPTVVTRAGMPYLHLATTGVVRYLSAAAVTLSGAPLTYIGVSDGGDTATAFAPSLVYKDASSSRNFGVTPRYPRLYYGNGNTNFAHVCAGVEVLTLEYASNHGSATGRVDGSALTLASSTNPSNTISDLTGSDITLYIGTIPGGDRGIVVYSGEQITFNQPLTSTERENVENYLMREWQ